MATQPGWRWCARCQALAFAGSGPGPCAGGGTHDHSASGAYVVAFDDGTGAAQPDWRWCAKCQALAFAGSGPGPCVAGGVHDHSTSGAYMVAFQPPSSSPLIDAIAYWPPKDEASFFRGLHNVRYRMAGPERAEELIFGQWWQLALTAPLDAVAT